jgi:hypothetical protein
VTRLKVKITLLLVIVVAPFLFIFGTPALFLAIGILGILAIFIRRLVKKRSKRRTSFQRVDVPRMESTSLDRQEYGTRCVTLNGEIVRSKGECRVADFLFQSNIRYKYEPRVYGKFTRSRDGRPTRNSGIIGKPDFLLLDYDILVEYWGMVTVPDQVDRMNYQKKMNEKKMLYEQNGYKLISLYSWDLDNLQFEFNRQLKLLSGSRASQA